MSYDVPPRIDPSKLSVDQMVLTARLNFNRVLQVAGKTEDEVRDSFRTAMRLHSFDDHDEERMSLKEELAARRQRLQAQTTPEIIPEVITEAVAEEVEEKIIDLNALDKAGLLAFAKDELGLEIDKRKSEATIRDLIRAHIEAQA